MLYISKNVSKKPNVRLMIHESYSESTDADDDRVRPADGRVTEGAPVGRLHAIAHMVCCSLAGVCSGSCLLVC